MAASKKTMGDLHEAVAKRLTNEVENATSPVGFTMAAITFLNHNKEYAGAEAGGHLEELKKAQEDRNKRRGRRFASNPAERPTNVIDMPLAAGEEG